ncbi:MAG TPA: TIGR03086 family metal-binding protein [Jatrophihabitantaceae bacterium]|jgi:uncharacterized protein (TIGR03086 family)
MDNQLAMLDEALREFTARVDAVADDQWDGPTPASEWSVRDLIGHVVDEHRWAPPLVNGHDLAAAEQIVKGSRSTRNDAERGLDLKAEWHDVATASAQAFGEPGALERQVSLSRGPTPCTTYLDEMLFDLVVHGWDLGKAIGYPGSWPEALVESVWHEVQRMGDLHALGGDMFAPAVAVPDDAPALHKLVGATGRDPR